jgi:hypothetical protein
MAIVKDINQRDPSKQFVVSGSGVSDFTWGDKSRAQRLKRSSEWATRAAEILRDSGRSGARACDAAGNAIPVPGLADTVAATKAEKIYETADIFDGTRRQVPPVRLASSGYFCDANIYEGGRWYTESIGPGKTPAAALEMLFSDDRESVRKYTQTLEIVERPAEAPAAIPDLSTLQPFSEKEFALFPAKETKEGGLYFTDAVFRQRVNLMLKKRKEDAATRAAASDL